MKKNKKSKKKVINKIRKTATPTRKQELVIKVQSMPTSPEIITPKDLEPEKDGGKYRVVKSWLSEGQVLRMIQKTPSNLILKRKGRGGQWFDYVPGWYFKKALNFSFGWNWDFAILKQEVIGKIGDDGTQVITTGRLTVKDDKGHTIYKDDNGKADIKYLKGTKTPMDIGNDFKSSATDALKRCCVQLGIASDVYGRNDLKHDTGMEVTNYPQLPPNTPINANKPQSGHVNTNTQPKEGQKVGPDGKPTHICEVCKDPISDQTADYSMKIYKKRLCREHQIKK